MVQQWSLAKKGKKSDVGMVTGKKSDVGMGHRLKGQEIRCSSGKNDLHKKSKRNDEHPAIPTPVTPFLF